MAEGNALNPVTGVEAAVDLGAVHVAGVAGDAATPRPFCADNDQSTVCAVGGTIGKEAIWHTVRIVGI
jgi:hypothetical protein